MRRIHGSLWPHRFLLGHAFLVFYFGKCVKNAQPDRKSMRPWFKLWVKHVKSVDTPALWPNLSVAVCTSLFLETIDFKAPFELPNNILVVYSTCF